MNNDNQLQTENIKKLVLIVFGVLASLLVLFFFISSFVTTRQPSGPEPTPSFSGLTTPMPSPAADLPKPEGEPPFPVEVVKDPNSGQEVKVVKDRLIVKFKIGVTIQQRQALWQSLGGVEEKDLGLNIFSVFFAETADLEKIRQEFEKSPLVEYSERDAVVEIFYTPNDYNLTASPWWWGQINAQEAWDYSRGNRQIILGVLDTGISSTHEDLAGRVQIYDAAIPYQGAGTHGTHVAGIAGASTDNNLGVASIGFDITIYGIQALSNSGGGSSSQIIAAINKAASLGVNVINMSLGYQGSPTQSMQDAIDNAWQSGVLIVAAAGNSNTNASNFYPANHNRVLSVAATTSSGGRASFSNYGSWVDVAAPGVNIVSSVPGGYAPLMGTSMASPVVAGLAALCWTASPGLTNQQVQDYIINNATANSFTAQGLVNAEETLKACGQLLATPTPTPPVTPLSCYPMEWLCADDDIERPEIYCCQFECLLYPQQKDYFCRTNEDEGQKDGTGKTGFARHYPYYDYERGKVLEVPPVIQQIIPMPTPGCVAVDTSLCGSTAPAGLSKLQLVQQLAVKFGVDALDGSKSWTVSELEKLWSIFGQLSCSATFLQHARVPKDCNLTCLDNIRLIREPTGTLGDGGYYRGYHEVLIFDKGVNIYTIAHELGHGLARSTGSCYIDDIYNADTVFTKFLNQLNPPTGEKYICSYPYPNPPNPKLEDFAEMVTDYVESSLWLRGNYLKHYNFAKDTLFGSYEYGGARTWSCTP